MEVQGFHRRWLLIGGFLLLGGFGAVVAQLFELQVRRHDELAGKARKFFERTYVKASRRGDIRDVRGTLLATSKPVKTVCADPSVMGTNYVKIATTLAPLLEMERAELIEKLQPRFVTNSAGKVIEDKYVVLKHKVEVERWEQITNAMMNLQFTENDKALPKKTRDYLYRIRAHSLMTEPDEVRVYPNGALAAHLLGFAGVVTETTPSGEITRAKGMDGLELMLDSVLSGVAGWVQSEIDSQRREIVTSRDQAVAPREGLDAYLTIDAGVQHIVESAIAEAFEKYTPESVSAAVMRPRTGEILAMANLPTFDPNRITVARPNDLRNRFVTDAFEPGSTFKVVVVSGALNDRIVTLGKQYNCENGLWYFCGKPLHDAHKVGVTDVEGIIAHSSNIGAAKIGIEMGQERLYNYITRFGFGTRTGITLPGESPGISHPVKKWNGLSISRIPMGQGISATPLQTLMAMSAIANDGLLMKPIVISKLVDRNGTVVAHNDPMAVRQVISPSAAHEIVKALKAVVATNGTGAKAAMPFYTVAGKTGTAQKPAPGGYSRDKYFSSFIGFFPADDPEICISVVMDAPDHKKGYYGADVAIPVFRNIAERAARYLAIPMEKQQPQPLPKETLAMTGVRTVN
jgi:cell division protein FtsI (penicillin-binding protein 3)